MVVAEKVEHAVDQQSPHLGRRSTTPAPGLAPGRVERYYNVSQNSLVARCARPLSHGKSQNVRGPVLAAIVAVELVNRLVVDEDDCEVGATLAELAQKSPGIGANRVGANTRSPHPTQDRHRHGRVLRAMQGRIDGSSRAQLGPFLVRWASARS